MQRRSEELASSSHNTLPAEPGGEEEKAMRKGALAVVFGMLIAFWSSPAFAVDAQSCDPLDGLSSEILSMDPFAEVQFKGCFLVEDYTPGTDVNVTVDWQATGATCGSAGDVTLRGQEFTPPPANGKLGTTTTDTNSVTFVTSIDPLKTAGRAKLFAIGHYAVPLECTIDAGDPIQVFLGVNLRVVGEVQ
jgi:hypothetical protein